MKKGKRSAVCFAVCCLLLCAVLSLGILAFGPAGAGANERLAQKPKLSNKGKTNWSYLSQLSDWIGDHFWLRQELITARNGLAALSGSSPVEDVILGRDGWLYYAPTLEDYTGSAPLSDGDLASAAANLGLMAEYCRDRGLEFLFVPVPNKNSLYPEHMPGYTSGEERDLQRLLALLPAEKVPFADLYALFSAQGETLYYAHDSHWTVKGAALAADGINAALGRESRYFAGDFSEARRHDGDLYEMLYPAARDPETGPTYGGTFRYTREGTDTRPDSITINTTGEGNGSLLAYRDSFGNDLYPFLADSFASSRFSRSTVYDLTAAEKLGADTVLVELVERNLSYLLTYVPKMPAPLRGLSGGEETSSAVDLARSADNGPEGCVGYSGILDPAAGRAYLQCAGGCYEAFRQTDGGFSAWLPEGETPERVLYRLGDRLLSAPVGTITD